MNRSARIAGAGKINNGDKTAVGSLAADGENPRLREFYRAAAVVAANFRGKIDVTGAAAGMSRGDKRKGVETSPDNW